MKTDEPTPTVSTATNGFTMLGWEPTTLPDRILEASAAELPYDDELRQQLEDAGPADLRAGRPVVVDGVRDPARYNTAVWFAAKYGLRWTNVPFEGRVVIELDERG